jgi:dTDP-4-dehydrorhamnose 3,5-epimerase
LTRPFIIAVSLLTFCIGLFPATGPHAAEIRAFQYAQDYDDGPGAYIVMVGETVTGDTDRFLDALPRAIALHGFVTREPATEILYKCTDFYAPDCDGAVRWDSCGIDWGMDTTPVLSDKDAGAVAFEAFESPFTYEA